LELGRVDVGLSVSGLEIQIERRGYSPVRPNRHCPVSLEKDARRLAVLQNNGTDIAGFSGRE
jgi:hypothetical protein